MLTAVLYVAVLIVDANYEILLIIVFSQKSEYESILQDRSVTVFGRELTTIEELCTLLRYIVLQERDPIEAIEAATNLFEDVQGVSSDTVSNITTCLLGAVQ